MNKRKIIIICVSLVLLLTLPVGVTIAYLGTRDSGKTNKLKIDQGRAAVSEVFSSPAYQLPQNTVKKEVAVENDGSEPCFVRVYLDFSDNLAKEKALFSLSTNPNDNTYYSFDSFKSNISTLSSGKWKYVSDNTALGGYFYYTEKVSKEQKTEPLIRYVKTDFSAGEPNSATVSDVDLISDFDIIVYSETVQTIFDGTEENNWQNAWKKFLRVP